MSEPEPGEPAHLRVETGSGLVYEAEVVPAEGAPGWDANLHWETSPGGAVRSRSIESGAPWDVAWQAASSAAARFDPERPGDLDFTGWA